MGRKCSNKEPILYPLNYMGAGSQTLPGREAIDLSRNSLTRRAASRSVKGGAASPAALPGAARHAHSQDRTARRALLCSVPCSLTQVSSSVCESPRSKIKTGPRSCLYKFFVQSYVEPTGLTNMFPDNYESDKNMFPDNCVRFLPCQKIVATQGCTLHSQNFHDAWFIFFCVV